jgi:hypothetical protein
MTCRSCFTFKQLRLFLAVHYTPHRPTNMQQQQQQQQQLLQHSGAPEGPPIWMEVKYGTPETLKNMLQQCTQAQVSQPGGVSRTSPVHEAIARHDLQMVDMLRYALCDLQYTPVSGPAAGCTPRQFARLLIQDQPSPRYTIWFNLCTEARQRATREANRALYREMRKNRALFLAFAAAQHDRLGRDTDAWLHNAPDEVMKMIYEQVGL